MKENLKVTHYNNGTLIPNDTSTTLWKSLSTGARCYYNNDSIANAGTYGALYNWYTVSDSNLCPIGWHVPTDSEWTTLVTYLGGDVIAGDKMKESGTIHWNSGNNGTNSSGFTALSTGARSGVSGSFYGWLADAYFWSSTVYDTSFVWYRFLYYSYSGVHHYADVGKTFGFSMRCLKDIATEINDINYHNNFLIYPNPATDRVYIDCAVRQNMKVQVYNVIGECVLQRELSSSTNDIDISSLSKGIYVIKLTGANWTVQRKLTKE